MQIEENTQLKFISNYKQNRTEKAGKEYLRMKEEWDWQQESKLLVIFSIFLLLQIYRVITSFNNQI